MMAGAAFLARPQPPCVLEAAQSLTKKLAKICAPWQRTKTLRGSQLARRHWLGTSRSGGGVAGERLELGADGDEHQRHTCARDTAEEAAILRIPS